MSHSRSATKRHWIVKRLTRLRQKLEIYAASASMARKAAVLSAGLMAAPMIANAQDFQLKSEHPFFNVFGNGSAAPTFVDYDGDGDRDLFLFSEADTKAAARTEALRYFENTGSAFEEGSVDQFPMDLGLPVLIDSSFSTDLIGSFTDFDADGDLDLFIGVDEGELRYLRNEEGTYVAITGAEDPFDTVTFEQDIMPAFGDVDGDGDVDAFLGNENELVFYQNEGGEMVNMGKVTISGEDDGAAPTLFDVDDDGDLDLIVGNKDGDVFFFENNAGVFTETMHPLSALKTDDYIRPTFGDVDFDGDVDFVAGETNSRISVFAKDGESYNEVPFNTLGLIVEGTQPSPHFADFDGDGDQDLFVGDNSGKIHYFNNNAGTYELVDGFDTFSEIEPEISDAKPAFIDYDGDADLDLLVGSYSDPLQLFNNNAGSYSLVDTLDNPFFKLIDNDAQAPAFSDVDGDGDMDLILGSKSGDLKYYENNAGVFDSAAVSPFDGIDVGTYSSPTFADIDGDGDADIIIGTGDDDLTTVFNNDGTYVLAEGSDNPFDGFKAAGNTSPALSDMDGDGDLDVLVGDYAGSIYYFENGGVTSVDNRLDVSSETELFPNPLVNNLNILTPWNEQEAEIDIYDNQGRRILHRSYFGGSTRLNLRSLPVGNYHVKIHNKSNKAIRTIIKTQ